MNREPTFEQAIVAIHRRNLRAKLLRSFLLAILFGCALAGVVFVVEKMT